MGCLPHARLALFLVATLRAKCFDEAPNCPTLSVAGSMTGSVAIAGAPSSDEITDERPHTEGDADGLIRITGWARFLWRAGWDD
jgi:hypothetical protein